MLVEPASLEAALGDPHLRIVDATWYLPAQGRDARVEYAAGHLPGAIHLDLSRDLGDATATVRNMSAPPAVLAKTFAAAGVGTAHRAVVYDRLAGFSAGRVWWALRLAGHPDASLLDGGYERWIAEGRAVTDEVPALAPAHFESDPQPALLAERERVLEVLRSGGARIIDAREPERFRGVGPEPTRHKGHIPGSASVPYTENLAGDPPRLRPLGELRELYRAAGVRFDEPVITTCGSGVTASLTAFVLALLGHPHVAVYDGSWAEWGDADDTPVEAGP